MNETYACLIPMKEKTNKVKDFRPISLVACFCKIIAKVGAKFMCYFVGLWGA